MHAREPVERRAYTEKDRTQKGPAGTEQKPSPADNPKAARDGVLRRRSSAQGAERDTGVTLGVTLLLLLGPETAQAAASPSLVKSSRMGSRSGEGTCRLQEKTRSCFKSLRLRQRRCQCFSTPPCLSVRAVSPLVNSSPVRLTSLQKHASIPALMSVTLSIRGEAGAR